VSESAVNRDKRSWLPDFQGARTLFAAFRYRRQQAKDPNSDWIAEADKRLEQLEWIIQHVDALQNEHDALLDRQWIQTSADDQAQRRDRRDQIVIEVELLVEAFYYFAWRFKTIVGDEPGLDGLKGFDPIGVRDVRNLLIEHAFKSKASNSNFTFGREISFGPVIKPFGSRLANRVGKEPHDKGLYVNAREFIKKLTTRLEAIEIAAQDESNGSGGEQ
jgi:hypothetical protein